MRVGMTQSHCFAITSTLPRKTPDDSLASVGDVSRVFCFSRRFQNEPESGNGLTFPAARAMPNGNNARRLICQSSSHHLTVSVSATHPENSDNGRRRTPRLQNAPDSRKSRSEPDNRAKRHFSCTSAAGRDVETSASCDDVLVLQQQFLIDRAGDVRQQPRPLVALRVPSWKTLCSQPVWVY